MQRLFSYFRWPLVTWTNDMENNQWNILHLTHSDRTTSLFKVFLQSKAYKNVSHPVEIMVATLKRSEDLSVESFAPGANMVAGRSDMIDVDLSLGKSDNRTMFRSLCEARKECVSSIIRTDRYKMGKWEWKNQLVYTVIAQQHAWYNVSIPIDCAPLVSGICLTWAAWRCGCADMCSIVTHCWYGSSTMLCRKRITTVLYMCWVVSYLTKR